MRQAKWTILLVTVATVAWSQQAVPPAQSGKVQTKAGPVIQEDAPHLSQEDQSLACPAETESQLAEDNSHKADENVKPPKPIKMVNAYFSDEARSMAKKKHIKNFQAISLVSLLVDPQGNPQDVCVQKPAGYGLDGEAIKAVEQYRFKPATRDGSPVPVHLTVEVNFRLY
jgi:TonB family protein